MVARKSGGKKQTQAPKRNTDTEVLPMQIRREIRGFFDAVQEQAISGWAVNIITPREPLKLRVLIDGVTTDVLNCDQPRQDAKAHNLPAANVGFSYGIPLRFMDGSRHVLKLATIDGVDVVLSSDKGTAVPEVHFCLTIPTHVEGVLDGVVDGLVQGWALAVNEQLQSRTGGMRILVTCLGQPVAELVADQYRADVAEALNADANCGFTFSAPVELRHKRHTAFRFFAMPGRYELRGSPVEIAFPTEGERERINDLISRTDELFSFAYHLRRELKAALPGERYMLADYRRWIEKAAPLALPRATTRYGALGHQRLLVSIVCPVFRPEKSAFLAAIDSVRMQTYSNWELLLVDDGSDDAELTAMILELAAQDRRIKLISISANSGISNATNKGLENATGEFVAFFDHDDLLVPAALEIMLMAQAATGAKLLYSDEDKVDASGAFSDPHFKPDFNYRFLLELNYICHFVMLDAAFVKRVGPFNSIFDGAQDHDFLLRAVENLSHDKIHHVSEILYHWRKSERSAAGSAVAKPQAASRGEAAVAAHLKRRNINASVERRRGLTCYRVKWAPAEPAMGESVSILIPFRDHISTTAKCVNALRSVTKDVQYEIILLDNWSNEDGSQEFLTEQANLPDTAVVRIVEPFNYSRINNIGSRLTKHKFILFLNNDVVVNEPGWLRTMLNELLVDERVGAVGAKLLYPNGTVQHAGVVLGVGGVADHAFRGIPADAPGYVMRAMAAQEISAVTAACMLVRKCAFEEVGGFDEQDLSVAFNDVDLCLKLVNAGWKVIFTPDATAEHHESISRGVDFDEDKVGRFMLENEVMRRRYADVLPHDPFYNRHFSREGNVYRELKAPQEER